MKDSFWAISRAASVYSYLILLGGLLTLAVTVYLVAINYSSLPFLDGWAQIQVGAQGADPLAPSWLWYQHNEHRLILPKLFLAADLEWYQARQTFLLASILVIQVLHWVLLSWSMWVLGGWRGTLWRTGCGLAAFCFFCPSQWQNFTWGFQVCFVLPQLLATASFVTLLLYWKALQEEPDKQASFRLIIVSLLAALGATYSLASGSLLWPLLVAAALYLRLPLRAILSYAITGLISTALYLHHYVRPPHHANLTASLAVPVVLLKYFALYFYSSWFHRGTATWEVVLVACFGLIIILLTPALRFDIIARAFSVQMILVLLFCAGTALITAAGRWNLGVEQARASRYQTVALLFWCCLGLLWLGAAFATSRPRYVFALGQLSLLVIFVRGAAYVSYPMKEASERSSAQRLVAASLITGVYDPDILSKSYPDLHLVATTVPYMKANHLSIFSTRLSSELGQPLSSVFPLAATGECVGHLKGGMPAGPPGVPGLVLAGWAWDVKRREAPSSILVTTDGVISGLGAIGDWQAEPPAAYSKVWSESIGFFALVPGPKPGAVVNLYAILRSNPPSACYLDGWRQSDSAPRPSLW